MLRDLQQTTQTILLNDFWSDKVKVVQEAAKRKATCPNLRTYYLTPRALHAKGLALSRSPSRGACDTLVQRFIARECKDAGKRGLESLLRSDFLHRKLLQQDIRKRRYSCITMNCLAPTLLRAAIRGLAVPRVIFSCTCISTGSSGRHGLVLTKLSSGCHRVSGSSTQPVTRH
jgi:hypothetical protein